MNLTELFTQAKILPWTVTVHFCSLWILRMLEETIESTPRSALWFTQTLSSALYLWSLLPEWWSWTFSHSVSICISRLLGILLSGAWDGFVVGFVRKSRHFVSSNHQTAVRSTSHYPSIFRCLNTPRYSPVFCRAWRSCVLNRAQTQAQALMVPSMLFFSQCFPIWQFWLMTLTILWMPS